MEMAIERSPQPEVVNKDIILQKANVDYINNAFGKELWIQISGNKYLNGSDAAFWCGLVEKDSIDSIFNNPEWDISAINQSCPGFEDEGYRFQYKKNILGDCYESIIYYRDFYGVETNYIELSQEFILFNNLRYDCKSKSYWAMYDSGEREEAVKYVNDETVIVKLKFLRNYSAAKQMAIVLYFDMRCRFDGCLSKYGLEKFLFEEKKENIYYQLWGDDMSFGGYAYSVLMGKKIIMPKAVEECGYWLFEKEQQYEDYIIGEDDFGKEIVFTCDPGRLSNYFGSNPEAPHYLTPVFFKREVLQKYISKPELYEVGDGYLSCKNLWRIAIDNHLRNYVAAYLGDLGRDLPECERGYWKSFNVVADARLSATTIQRDFLNISAPSTMADHRFKSLYYRISKKWETELGWPFFLPLSEKDQYNYTSLRIPITDSQQEFDQLVLSLVKVLVDSLNEKKLKPSVVEKNDKGIDKLEKWFVENGLVDFEEHIGFLRDLQELRSSGSGHRKGKAYAKISSKFCLDENSKIDTFIEILNRASGFLMYLEDVLAVVGQSH